MRDGGDGELEVGVGEGNAVGGGAGGAVRGERPVDERVRGGERGEAPEVVGAGGAAGEAEGAVGVGG